MQQFDCKPIRYWPVLLLTMHGIIFMKIEHLLINATFRLRPYLLLASAAAYIVWQLSPTSARSDIICRVNE